MGGKELKALFFLLQQAYWLMATFLLSVKIGVCVCVRVRVCAQNSRN